MLIHECIYLINQYQSCIMCIFSQSSNSNLLILGVILYHDVLCISNYDPNIHVHLFPITFFYQYQSWWNINVYWFAGKFTSETLHSLMEKTMGFRLRFPLSFQSIDDSSNGPKSSKSPGWQVGKTNRPNRPHVVMEWWPGEFYAETGRNFQSYHKTYIDFNFF